MADNFKLKLGVEPNVNSQEIQKKIDGKTKNVKVNASVEPKYSKELVKYYKDLEKQVNQFNKKNISSIDLEIKKRSEQAKLFSKQIKAQMLERANLEKQSQNSLNLKSNKIQLDNKISTFLNENSRLSDGLRNRLIDLQNQISSVDKTGLSRLTNEFKEVRTEAKMLGQVGKTSFQSFKDDLKNFSTFLGAGTVIMSGINGVRKFISNVFELDTSMINLKKVTDETDSAYNKFLDKADSKAQKLGRSISSLVTQSSEWAKLGFDINESAELANASSVYSNVGEVDDTTAVGDLVTVLKSLKLEASDAITIVDKLNAVSNNYAVSAADLGTGLKNSISAMSLAGNNLDETIALLTAMSEITQNASESGNAIKVLSMRLRGAESDLEGIGEETDGIIKSVSTLRETIKSLTDVNGKGGFDIMADDANFKSTYDIMKGISEVWNEISNVDQANLLQIIAGKQRGNSVSALLTSMSQAENVLATSVNSAGSAMEEQEQWLDSLEAKTQQFGASVESLSRRVVDSNFLKFIVDTGTDSVNVLTSIIDLLGAMPTLLTTISGGLSAFRNQGLFQINDDGGISNVFAIKKLEKSQFTTQLANDISALEAYEKAVASGKVNTETFAEIMGKASVSAKEYAIQTSGATGSSLTFAESQKATNAALLATGESSVAASIGMKALSVAMNVGVMLLITEAIRGVVWIADQLVVTTKELEEEVKNSKSTYESAKSSLSSVNTELEEQTRLMKELESKGNLTYAEKGQLEELKEITKELQVQRQIAEDTTKTTQENLALSSARIVNKKYNVGNITNDRIEDLSNRANSIKFKGDLITDENDLVSMIVGYKEFIKLRDEALDSNYLDLYQKNIDSIKDIDSSIRSNIEALIEQKANMLDAYNTITQLEDAGEGLTSSQKEIKKAYEATSSAIETLFKNISINEWNNIQFSDVFDSQEFEKSKKALQDLAKSGELDEKVITSNEEYKKLINDTGLTAQEVVEQIKASNEEIAKVGSPSSSTSFDFASNEEAIDSYQSTVKELSSVLESINSGTFSDSDMIDLIQKFPTLQGKTDDLSGAIKELINNSLSTLLSTLGESAPTELVNSLQGMANAVTNLNSNLSDTSIAINALDKISDGMSKLDDAFANRVINGELLDSSQLKGLQDTFGELDGFDNFIKTISNSSSTVEQLQQAFNNLTSEFIINREVLKSLTFENAELMATQLKAMGVANAEEVVFGVLGITIDQYAQLKAIATQRGIDLANITYQEIQALLDENQITQETAQSMYVFALRKALANDNVLSTTSDIRNLMALVTSLGGTTSALQAYYKAKNAATQPGVGSDGMKALYEAARDEANAALATAEAALYSTTNLSNAASNINYTGGADSAKALENNLKNAEKAAKEAKTAVEELADAISKLESDYDKMLTLLTDRAEKIQNALKLEESKGNLISPKFYKELISESNKEMSLLNKKIAEYQKLLDEGLANGTINKFDENWYKLTQGIEDTKDKIMQCTIAVEEFQNKINELKWQKLKLLTDQIDDMSDEIKGLLNLLDNKSLINEDGTWSDEGITSLALLAQQYETNMYKAKQYADAINELEKDYRKGKYSTTEYMAKLAELKKAQLDVTNAAEEERQAIIDLNKERVEAAKSVIQDEIDAYEELIEKKKEALETEEEAYQLSKKINDKQKNIDTIQSKIDALSGDTSASGIAKRRQLEAQLAEAQEDLNETYHDNAHDATIKALDKELKAYKETKQAEVDALEASLKNQELLISASLTLVQTNYETVYATLSTLADDYNLNVSDAIMNPWKEGEGAIASYGETLSNSTSAFIEQLNSVKDAINDIASAADNAASSILKSLNSQDVGTADVPSSSGGSSSTGGGSSSSGGGSGKGSGKVNGYQVIDSSGYVIKQFRTKAEADAYAQKISTSYAKTKGKTVSVQAYAKGTRNAKSGIANVDEEGLELILGKAENGRWRIMDDGDQVFTKAQTDNLFDLANINPSTLLANVVSSNLSSSVPSVTTNTSSNSVQIGSLVTVTGSVSDSNLSKIESVVQKQINKTFKTLNYTLKKSGG